MSHDNITLSEKKKIIKKVSFVAIVLIAAAAILVAVIKLSDRNETVSQAKTESVEGLIDVDGVSYVPKKNIETYLFMGIDNRDKVEATDDYEGAGRCDVIMLMVRDRTEGTYQTLTLDRNTMVEQKSLKPDGEVIGSSVAQLSLAHENGDGLESSCENVVDAVSGLLGGQKIDGYAAVNMGAIGIINNLAGGVTVTIEDDFSQVDPTMIMGSTITLSDEQAYNFVSGRMGVGDESNTQRMKRQAAYEKGLKENLMTLCSQDNTYPLTIYEALGDYMVTNITSQKFSKLALLVLKDKDNGSLRIDGTETIDNLGFIEVNLDEDSLQQVILQLFYKKYE
jgi:anionic cell wall polymer biosynthesis LytR-Cps2A-Psr (LCP) family protein